MRDSRILILGLLLTTAADGRGCCTREYLPAQGTNGASQNPASDTTGSGPSTLTTGTWSTLSGISSSSVNTQTPEAEPQPSECRGGARRPCAETSAGAAIWFPSAPPVGRCRLGEQKCNLMGKWGPCEGAIAPLPKDDCNIPGDDSDCDGSPNKDCECAPAIQSTRVCGSPVGDCRQGVQHCTNGTWGRCKGDIGPEPEACDGKSRDKDCDGKVDLRDGSCECLTTDRPQLCELPSQQGDCRLGTKTCDGGRWSPCRPRFFKGKEHCGSRPPDQWGAATGDEDCDGHVDEAGPDAYAEGCRYFILDADQDGFGAIGPSTLQNPRSATHGCFCGSPPTRWNFVEASGKDKVNKDCAECDAQVPDTAYPTRNTTGSECLRKINWPGGVFDYNCNGRIDLHYNGYADGRCDIQEKGSCKLTRTKPGFWYIPPGEERKIPQCGESGSGNIYCEPGKNKSGQPICTLKWWNLEQLCH